LMSIVSRSRSAPRVTPGGCKGCLRARSANPRARWVDPR
jgi:hypothetical protein